MVAHLIAGVTRVWVGRDPGVADILGDRAPRTTAVVGQPGVAAAVADRVGALLHGVTRVARVTIPDGEEAKSLAAVEWLCRRFAEAGLERGDLVVVVGGGAATDATGFAAAVYLRGVAVHHVPTTLLGAVDAAIGGKTAVNLVAKNQVGAFHHPGRVVIDLEVLEALPESLLRQGAAEALKAGLVGDPVLVELLERDGLGAPLEDVVGRAVGVKAALVTADPEDHGVRRHLNYGHTIGHALERSTGTTHGEAVAVGMVAAGRASSRLLGFGGEDRQRAVLERLGLPVAAPAGSGEVLRLLEHDKKRSGGQTTMVLLAEVGRPQVTVVDDATVAAALHAIGLEGGSE